MTFHIRNWRMNSVTDMVLQNSTHPHPGTGVHLNHALTGNQSQIAQGLKGLIFILDIGIIPGTVTSPIHPLTYQFYHKTGNSQCSTGGSTKPSSHPFFFLFFPVNSPRSATKKTLHFYLILSISSKRIIEKDDPFILLLKFFRCKM